MAFGRDLEISKGDSSAVSRYSFIRNEDGGYV